MSCLFKSIPIACRNKLWSFILWYVFFICLFVSIFIHYFTFHHQSGQCIVVYWQQSQWRGGPIKCPVCRQQVNILLPCFQLNNINQNVNNNSMVSNSNTESTTSTTNGDSSTEQQPFLNPTNNIADTARQVTSQINSYNRRFSGDPRPVCLHVFSFEFLK